MSKKQPTEKPSEPQNSGLYDRDYCAYKECTVESTGYYNATIGFCDKHWKVILNDQTDNDSQTKILRLIKQEAKNVFNSNRNSI